jgi:ubiquinol-cytochrome c reductase cytochrome c1 subunit
MLVKRLLLATAFAAATAVASAQTPPTTPNGAPRAPAPASNPATTQGARPNGQANPLNSSVHGQSPAASSTGAPGAEGSAPGQVEVAPLPQAGPARPTTGGAPLQSVVTPAPSTEALAPKHVSWSFTGPFGVYDRAALQRGFQIYKQVCSACHALSHVAFRNLGDPGGPEFTSDEVKAIAAGFMVPAGPNEMGQTVDANGTPLARPGTASDYFPPPFANEQAARMANNGALPPDLSLIVKARSGNQDYVYSILTGFGQTPPANERVAPGLYYNPYFPRHQIAMPPPLMNGSVTFADGTPNTLDQEAHDIVTFLAWASEPTMDERKRMGFNALLYLIGLAVLLFFSYRHIWHGRHDVGAVGEGTGKETRLAP